MEKPTVLIVCILLAFFGVFVSADGPTCENVTLHEYQLTTTCTITSAYENIKCQFTLQKGGIDTKNITDDAVYYTTHNGPRPGGSLFNITSCILLYPVNGLQPGNWTVKVIMDIVGSFNQVYHGQAANTLLLSIPTVNIDLNFCPKGLPGEGDTTVRHGYIRQGERASCLCTLAHAGNPPGRIDWTSTQGVNVDISSQNESASIILIKAPDTFTCRSVSVLDGSHSMMYTPKYAYGPTNASVTFEPPGPFYLCPNQQTNITVTCKVPENSFNPGLLFSIRESSDYIAKKEAGDTAWSKSGIYSLTRSGRHTFLCRAENKIFGDIFIVNRTNLHVYPHISIRGTSVKKDENGTLIRPGSDITVTCSVGPNNDPHVNSINLKCGQKTSTNGRLSVTVRSDMTCECNVEHNTMTICNGDHPTENITIRTALSNRTLSELEDSFPTGAVVGGTVGCLFALAFVVVGVFFCVRRDVSFSSDERVYDNPTHDSTEVDNSDLYSPYEPSPSVPAKDDDHQPTMTSATVLTEKYNPEPQLNLYDEIDPEDLNREEKLFATKPEAKATTGAKPNRPQVLKPNVKIKAKPKSPETDTKDSLPSNDVFDEGTEGPAQHSPNDDDEVYLNCQAKDKTDYQNLRMT